VTLQVKHTETWPQRVIKIMYRTDWSSC